MPQRVAASLVRIRISRLQVMGHTKTIGVLIGGALLFHDVITFRVATGMSLAVLGMVGYGYFSHKEKQSATPDKPPAAAADKGDKGGDETAVLLSPDSNGVDGPDSGAPC